jgi:hypothetical protein
LRENPCIVDETANLKLAAKRIIGENLLMQANLYCARLYLDTKKI